MSALEVCDGIAARRIAYPEVKAMRAPWTRAIGLIGRKRIDSRRAYLFKHCPSVHTCFMCVPIDVILCDKHMTVLHVETMHPWRTSSKRLKGVYAIIEATAGSAEELGITPGCSLYAIQR